MPKLHIRSALIILLTSATAASAWAQPDPADIAENCINRLRAITRHAGAEMRQITTHAVTAINELQDQDKPRKAARVARRALASIQEVAQNHLAAVHNTTENCLQALRRLDAPPPLMQAVREAGVNAAEHIQRMAHRSAAAIREALAD